MTWWIRGVWRRTRFGSESATATCVQGRVTLPLSVLASPSRHCLAVVKTQA